MSQFPVVAFLIPCFVIVRLSAAWCDFHEITFHVKARHGCGLLERLSWNNGIIAAPKLRESLEIWQPSTIVSAETGSMWSLGISNMDDVTSLASNIKIRAESVVLW